MPRSWERDIARAEHEYGAWLETARHTQSMHDARRAVYARRYLRLLVRLRDRHSALANVPSHAANSLCRLARSHGIDDLNPHALRQFVRDQGREGLLRGPNIGKRSVTALLAWAAT